MPSAEGVYYGRKRCRRRGGQFSIAPPLRSYDEHCRKYGKRASRDLYGKRASRDLYDEYARRHKKDLFGEENKATPCITGMSKYLGLMILSMYCVFRYGWHQNELPKTSSFFMFSCIYRR